MRQIKTPGFTADAALRQTALSGPAPDRRAPGVTPAIFPFDPPSLTVTWTRFPQFGGPNSPGILTVRGSSFTPSRSVELRIDNCASFPYQLFPTTSAPASGGYYLYPGGDFKVDVPCTCGGAASVSAVDLASGSTAQASATLGC